MTGGRHAIDLALDLARMPALARTSVVPPVPPNVIELMRIAAASPKACQDAVAATGESENVIIEASRFYLQQLLFRPDADSYRVLGIERGASRATARSHMRWLLQWLHPDRNDGLEAVYAARVLKAWREVSVDAGSAEPEPRRGSSKTNGVAAASFRLPWIKHPGRGRYGAAQSYYRGFALWFVSASLVIVFLALWSAVHFFGNEQTAAMIRMP